MPSKPTSRPQLEEKLWTPAELAERYGISLVTLRDWRYHGRGPRHIRIAGKPFYPQSAIAEFEQAADPDRRPARRKERP